MEGKRLRFDENNIRHTNHPPDKDYGLMSIPESKTPFPRHADPIEAKELYRRMQEALQRANMMMSRSSTNSEATAEDSEQRTSKADELKDRQHAEFLTKRKQFYRSEFLIAKQRNMSREIHPPGSSIGSNWRLDDADDHPHIPAISNVPARYMSIISRHQRQHPGSLVNQESVCETADQMFRSCQWNSTDNQN